MLQNRKKSLGLPGNRTAISQSWHFPYSDWAISATYVSGSRNWVYLNLWNAVTDFCLHYTLEQQNSHNFVDVRQDQQAAPSHLHTKDHAWMQQSKLAQPVTSLTLSGECLVRPAPGQRQYRYFPWFSLVPSDQCVSLTNHFKIRCSLSPLIN
jgi:hypothetical protein